MTNAKKIKQQVYTAIASLLGEKSLAISDGTPLIGDGSILNSMKLVELCLLLEDMATNLNFEFDWVSGATMSKSHSIFRTAGTLASEFILQMGSKQ